MNFNKHQEYEGKHAFMGASQFRWIEWDSTTLMERYYSRYAQEIGTVLHSLAQNCIKARIRLSKADLHLVDLCLYNNFIPKKAYDADTILDTLIPFVNDAIGYRMNTEVVLFYSENCFGTADAICYNEKDHVLLIHDLKTGNTPAHMEQLIVYSALFYLEYHIKPESNKTILRLYQNGNITEYIPDYMEIEKVMDTIIKNDNYIKMFK